MTELKPCPFCGGKDLINDVEGMEDAQCGFVECLGCHITLFHGMSQKEAMDSWNRRTSDAEVRDRALEEAAKAVPTTWLDSVLTGPKAVIGGQPWGCPEVENILRAVAKRIRSLKSPIPQVKP